MEQDPLLEAVCVALGEIGLSFEIDETNEFSKDPILGIYPMRVKDKISGFWILMAPFGMDIAGPRFLLVGFDPQATRALEVNRDGKLTALNGSAVLIAECSMCKVRYLTTLPGQPCPACQHEQVACVTVDSLPHFYRDEPQTLSKVGKLNASRVTAGTPRKEQVQPRWLFDPKRADTSPLRIEPEWDALRQRLSGPARTIPFPPLDPLEGLFKSYPNFGELRDHLLGLYALRAYLKEDVQRLKPILLVGPPACGKSSFVTALASLWSAGNFGRVNFGQQTSHFTLTGSDFSLRRARQGLIIDLLAGSDPELGPVRNPMLVIDEIDKILERAQFDPIPSLLGLLEANDARAFRDEFFAIPVDASAITYLAMANGLEGLPLPLLSRFQVFHIRPHTHEEFLDIVVPGQFSSWANQYYDGTFTESLTASQALQVAEIAQWNPRSVWSALTHLAAYFPTVLSPRPTFESLAKARSNE